MSPEDYHLTSNGALAHPEDAIVMRARQGDPQAFTQIVERYEARIYTLARQITQSRQDAEDVLQETFLKAYLHLATFEGHSRFYTWLTRIAVHESVSRLRRRAIQKESSLDEPVRVGEDLLAREVPVWEGNPEQRLSQSELRGILDAAIASLPSMYRAVFWLRDVEELSIEETATVLHLSVPAVKTRLMRARLLLRQKLTRKFRRKETDPFGTL